MKVALAQINTSMGAISENARKISHFLDEAKKLGADLTVFPELAVIGYPPKDLLEQRDFLERSHRDLERLSSEHVDQNFIVGFCEAGEKTGKGRYNSAALVKNGKVTFIQRKRLLPTYDVFDESRYFDPGKESKVTEVNGTKVGITICEDIWTDSEFLGRKLYSENPAKDLKNLGAQIFINISSSPYHHGKEKIRQSLAEKLVATHQIPLVYVNLVGGNDELLFDGGSFVMDERGKVIARAKTFQEDLIVADLKKSSGEIREWEEGQEAWTAQALTMGLRDYVKKCGFEKVVVGLSGGIDSSLVALLAVEALGAKQVTGVSMPSRFTSKASREDAEELARKLGCSFMTYPIESLMKAYDDTLADTFKDLGRDSTEENIQARIRGNLLMALSNKFGWLVLSTGNKSELAVGYCTQYGDMAGGLAVISDLPKLQVVKVAEHLNRKWKAIPQRVFERPPSAELRPNQKDEDSLPPYSILDPILELYIEEHKSAEEIARKGFDRPLVDRVLQMVDRNEFKRKQAAPGLRLSEKAFGVGRRMPIARGSA